MAKRTILTKDQSEKIEAYKATGRTVFVKNKRDGKCVVSLNGFAALSLEIALQKIDQHFSEI